MIRINWHKILDTVIIFLFILSAGSILFVFARNFFSILLFALLFGALIITGRKINVNIFRGALSTFFVFASIVLLIFFAHLILQTHQPQKFLQYGFILLNITSCVLLLIHIYNNRGINYFLYRLRFCFRIIMWYSILNFFAYFIIKNSSVELYGGYNYKYVVDSFHYLFFFDPKHECSLFGLNFVRNQGWFWEPGINQVYLNLLLYLEYFIFKQKNKLFLALIIFSVLTTYSTAGFIVLLIVLTFMMKSAIQTQPLWALLFLPFFLYFINLTNVNAQEKTETSSFQKRYLDLVEPYSIALKFPLFGVGLDRDYFQSYREIEHQMPPGFGRAIEEATGLERKAESTHKGSSNSITYLFASMGFPLSMLLLYCLFTQNLFIHNKILFSLIVFITVLSEPILLRPFFMVLIVSGIMSIFVKFTDYKSLS